MDCDLKATACKIIDDRASDLNKISQELWNNPELCYQEFHAHDILTSFLEEEGFKVAKKTPLETSFIARYGDNTGLKIGVICEYDALPDIGHACGHNLIAEAGVGAALGIKAVLMLLDNMKTELIVFGTPAEEGGGGKVKMIEESCFDEIDICMMAHPTPFEIPTPLWLARKNTRIVFHGKPSHAAAAPWEGINALSAATLCAMNIDMLRQQIKPSSRIQQIILDGGECLAIIPERSEMNIDVRGITDDDVLDLTEKVRKCAKGAAIATGCSIDITEQDPFYAALQTNKTLVNLYVENAKSLGVPFDDDKYVTTVLASTDMGNVSRIKPSIQPLFKIQTEGSNHSHKFTEATGHADNQLPTLNSAKSIAMTAIDVICNLDLMKNIKEDFEM